METKDTKESEVTEAIMVAIHDKVSTHHYNRIYSHVLNVLKENYTDEIQTVEGATKYLEKHGIDVEKAVKKGMKQINDIRSKLQTSNNVSDEDKEELFVQRHLLKIQKLQNLYFLNDLMNLLNTKHIRVDFVNEARAKLAKEIIRLDGDKSKLQTNVEGCMLPNEDFAYHLFINDDNPDKIEGAKKMLETIRGLNQNNLNR